MIKVPNQLIRITLKGEYPGYGFNNVKRLEKDLDLSWSQRFSVSDLEEVNCMVRGPMKRPYGGV